MLHINKTCDEGKLRIALEGRLDTVTAPELEKELKASLPGIKELILDFAGLDYISSAGLRVLLLARKTMQGQGEMRLLHVNDVILEILEVTGFAEILTIER